MKYLSDYISDKQTDALDAAGAFFAFSQKQFDEAKKEGVVYVNGPMGIICPKDTIKQLMINLEKIVDEGIAEDIKENGLNMIIRRELNNHEAYYTQDIASTVEALGGYPVTEEEIRAVFRNKNHEPERTLEEAR